MWRLPFGERWFGFTPALSSSPEHAPTHEQLREAFPYESASTYLLFDHDQKYGLEVLAAIRSMQITCVRTSIRSPWQNGVAERWVGSCRRDLLDHIIAMNERHLKRFLRITFAIITTIARIWD
jgi:putative transposase